jgi:ribosomal protein L35AE/L33A
MIHQRVVPDRFRTPQWQALAVVTIAFAVEKLFRANKNMSKEIVYKYKWRLLPLVWLLIFLPASLVLGAAWIMRQGFQEGMLFLLISLGLIIIVYWLLILGLADIRISDEGVSKTAFGVTWQRMNWVDVAKFQISSAKSPEDGQILRSFGFRSKKGAASFWSRVIFFQDRKQGMDELIKKMEGCISQHGIKTVDLSSTPTRGPML